MDAVKAILLPQRLLLPVLGEAHGGNVNFGIRFFKVYCHDGIYKKTTPDLSIVKRLGGSGATKVRTFIEANKFLDAYNTI